MVVHRRLAEFEGRSALRTWVYGICVRTASDYRRRASHKRELVTESPPEQAAADDPHEDVAGRQARKLLDGILSELDDDKRAVFVLFEIEELAMSEVAKAVGCPLQTAYSRLHAARALVAAAARRAGAESARREPA